MIPNRPLLDPLHALDPLDLSMLLAADPERLLGLIIELNHEARYHNRLDAITLLDQLLELRRARDPQDGIRKAS